VDPTPRDRPADGAMDATGATAVRWGIGDFFWIYFAGIAVSIVGSVVGVGITGDDASEPGALTLALTGFGQFGGWVAAAAAVTHFKGRSLRADFGLTLQIRDWWAVFAGMGLFLAATLTVLPLVELADDRQDVVKDLEAATGAKLAVLAVLAGIVAPICEELLFRGVLLRALRRRLSPVVAVAVQALVFALAHPLLSPTLGTFAVVPALMFLGVAAGVATVRRGDLSAAILLHIGFNLVTTVANLP
jgi:membrane protease YdiL (CAAX protease family)